ncbi:MAG TPA: hypothetical protein VKU02_16005, partial [Gemmataceae bacterium]|nr:hypothetical protein [Gemmataceae bacterium]
MNRIAAVLLVVLLGVCSALGWVILPSLWSRSKDPAAPNPGGHASQPARSLHPQLYQPRQPLDTSGAALGFKLLMPWKDPTSLEEIRDAWGNLGRRSLAQVDAALRRGLADGDRCPALLFKASMFMYEGDPKRAYQVLQEARSLAESSPGLAKEWLSTFVFFQGVAGLRRGEDENCLQCRGEGACIFPLRPTAVHTNPAGSRLAIQHFTEYLERFPNDPGARWLLNVAYMTLGEHPGRVPAKYLMTFDTFGAEFDIGRFRDIAHLVGVNRLNQAGGAIMDDFDNDGLLDLIVTSWDPAQS